MCGILGQIKIQKDILRDIDRFRASLDLLTHRGPDDSGMMLDKNFIFGHKRLNIIDLSSLGRQPMLTSDNKVAIVFNGEIYNYRELKRELVKKGYHFRTHTDTEVLINGYHCFGINFIHKCIGMFAFAIYDKRYNKAFLVRDRLGVKPLYYCDKNGRITFSSEIKAILSFEDINKRLNIDAVSSYLSFRYPILNDTFFEGVLSIPPGHYAQLENGRLSIVKYWDPADKYKEQSTDYGEDYYIKKTRELLSSSIKYRMISDVPIGALLSGGVDSSIITAMMAKESACPVETFTIGYDENGYNEFAYANKVAKRYKTHHHEIRTSEAEYFEDLEKMICFKDSPLSIPNEVTQYQLSRRLKKFVTVVLAGTGADEIFYGYGRIFRSVDEYERFKKLGLIDDKDRKKRFIKNFVAKYGRSDLENEMEHFLSIYPYIGFEAKKGIISSSVELDTSEEKIREALKNYFEEVETKSYLDKMGYAFLKVHLPCILHHNDISSMAASVELRGPFLDHRLVEFALSIPAKYKLKWRSDAKRQKAFWLMSDKISELYDEPKYILRKTFQHDIPRQIFNRKKIGFPVPLDLWLRGQFKDYISHILLSKNAKNRKLYNMTVIKGWLSMSDSKKAKGDPRVYQKGVAGKLWMLANLELFIHKYFD